MEHQMIQTVVFIWVVVFTSPMLCEQTAGALRYTNCRFNVTASGCPEYDDASWDCLRVYASCPEGTEYHCLRLHMDPSRFADGCAKIKVCRKGEMPYWLIINDGIPTHVMCDWCHNIDYFNPENKLSSTFSRCTFEKVKCNNYNSIECLPENKNDIYKMDRLCRCDARNNYILGDLKRLKGQVCTSDRSLEAHCIRADPCKDDLERLLNYTCVDKCKNGFRSNTSDECRTFFFTQPQIIEPTERPGEPISTAHSTNTKETSISSTISSTKVYSSPKDSLQNHKELPTLKFQMIQTTTKPTHNFSSSIYTISLVGVAMVVLLALAIGFFLRWCLKRKDKRRSAIYTISLVGVAMVVLLALAIGFFLRWCLKRKDKRRSDIEANKPLLSNDDEEETCLDSNFISEPESCPLPSHSQASNPSNGTTTVDVVVEPQESKHIAIQTDVDDGSQLENVKWIENQIKKNSEMLASGSTAEFDTLKNTFKQRGFDIVKKRECKENNNMPNIEAARIRHHATLPLLKHWKHKNLHYFVFPYMENGELLKAIADDFNRIQTEEKVQMNATRRVLILYKIACAMLFIHTPVGDLRKKMFHGHITSENIVLDENYNPRLRFTSQKQLPTESDLRDFGVLILEMLTGLTGEDSDLKERPLPDVDQFKRQFKECFENVWKDESIVYEDLFSLANECWKKTCEASLITTKLYDMLEGLNHTWENVASRKNRKCSLCTLNPIAEDTNLNLQNCMSTLSHVSPSVCVACMRDSYLNPIQCLRCRETIHTKIGSNMEAILISGYDEKMESRKTFENDVEKVKNILTSKYPLVFGISEDRVTTTLLRKFIEEKLTLKESTTTVLVYYTGHHDMDKGFLYDKNSFFTEKVFAACLESIKMDVVLIMDCCYATKFELKNVKLQLNASQCDKPAACFPNQHSLFTKLLYQSLYFEPTVSCVLGVTCRACLKYRSNDVNSGLIYLETLFCYINEHIELYKKENPAIVGTPTIHINAKDPIDFVFGYKHEREGISFFHEDEYINECTIYRLPSEKELKTELFKYSLRNRYKGDFVEKHGDKWRNFSDVIAITKRRYPHETDTHELSNIDEVIEASNMQFKLFFGIRNVKYLRNNSKVGVFFDVDKVNTQEILRIFSNSELFDVKLNNEMKQTVFKIPWRKVIEDKTRTELAKLKPTKIQNQDVAYEWVCGTLESIKLNPNIKPPAHVVFTVPSGLWGEDINDFLTIELEGLELQI